MDYFVAIDGKSVGPHTLEELASLNINGDTLIWHNGLDNWVKASTIKEVAEIIVEVPKTVAPPPLPPQVPAQPTGDNPPSSNLVLAIIGTALFFPIGVPALLKAISVSRLWKNGRRTEALAQSSSAKKLGILAMIIGAVVNTLIIIVSIAFS